MGHVGKVRDTQCGKDAWEGSGVWKGLVHLPHGLMFKSHLYYLQQLDHHRYRSLFPTF